MLFDLRGRGRRRTVQAIYLTLAIILGGGLVFLGIGSNTSGGGLLDALKGDGSGKSPDEQLDKDLARASKKVQTTPKDPAAWANLTRLRFRRANLDGFTSDKARPRLVLAGESWDRYLELDPKKPDPGLASVMVRVYSKTGLNEPVKALRAQEIFTAETKPATAKLYTNLAVLAYEAKEDRTGDLAAARAIELAEPAERKELRTGLESAKQQLPQQNQQPQQPQQPSG